MKTAAWAAALALALAAGLKAEALSTAPPSGPTALAGASAVSATPAVSLTPHASPIPAPLTRHLEADRAVDLGSASVDAELGTLDGGILTRALRRAARAKRPLRLLLDPYDRDSRSQGPLMEALATVRVRWRPGLSVQRRWMNVAGVGQLVWTVGRRPLLVASPPVARGFEKAWAAALRAVPRELVLRDELDALPDPREKSPHYVRRAGGVSPEGSDAKRPNP